jgi:hypothetical protein
MKREMKQTNGNAAYLSFTLTIIIQKPCLQQMKREMKQTNGNAAYLSFTLTIIIQKPCLQHLVLRYYQRRDTV